MNQPDYDAIKTKQQSMWASGNYSKMSTALILSCEQLCESMDVRSGQTVLDVAAGDGNTSLAAARRLCQVTSTDYVPELLAQSQRRAQVEGLDIQYQEADAENLPFDDAAFDNVVSTFGVMFAPNQAQAAAETQRVCKPGGKVGLASWTPESFVGQMFKIVGTYVAPPPGLNPPALWGTEDFINQHFAPHAKNVQQTKRQHIFRYPSPQYWLNTFRRYYGPTVKAFETLDEENAAALSEDIIRLISRLNLASDGTMVMPGE